MPGIKALRKIQTGRETTAGVATAATSLWRGLGTIEDQREVKFVEEDIGYISGVDRAYVPRLFGALEMDSVEATFEQSLHVFEAGIKAVGTGVVDTGGSGKVYTYTFPTTSKNTIKTYTLEGGDDQEAERMEYAFVQEFSLEGKGGEALMIKSKWVGRQVAVNAFTGGIVLPSVEDILFSKGRLYIDPVSGTMGNTQVSNSFLAMALNVNTGWVPKFTADGQLYFSFAKLTVPEITLEITFEHDGSAAAEKVNWRAGTPRQIRTLFQGSALTTAGTFQYKSLIIDLAGKWEKFSKLDEEDGNDIVTGTFRARYNATCAKFAQIKVVNQLATVP
jgi:hypothetical protein